MTAPRALETAISDTTNAEPTDAATPNARMASAQELRTQLVLRETPKSLSIGIVSAWLLAAGMWAGQPDPDYALRAFGWALVISLLLLRGVLIANTAADVQVRSARLQRNAVVLSLLWGGSSFAMPGSDFEHQALLVAAIALITTAGAVGRAVYVPRVPWFVMITSVVFAAGLLAMPGRFQLFIGLGYLLFGSMIAIFSRVQHHTVRRERELNLAVEELLRQTEAARREAERAGAEAEAARQLAERASAAKTRFLATASHDLRQPMHTIGLIVGLMRGRMRGAAAEPGLLDLAAKAQQSVDLMERLFGSLLDISKLDAGAVQADLMAVDLAQLLWAVEQTWAPQAAAKGLRLRVRPLPGPACEGRRGREHGCAHGHGHGHGQGHGQVRSDPELLSRIVNNLVSNAVNCTSRGGVLVACRLRGSHWVLQVWDSGPGIAPEHQAAIFEEFYRIDAPGNRPSPTQGLGLGLSIVQRSAQVLGHAVRLASRPGRGSCFEIRMPALAHGPPAQRPGQADLPAGEVLVSALAGCFVVVVDDDEANREAMAEVFRAQGCPVLAAASADALLQALSGHLRLPELVVTDHRLGAGANGLELLRRVRQFCEDAVPALIVSADTDAAVAAEAADLCATLLHKPVGPRRLVEAAAAALQRAAQPAQLPEQLPEQLPANTPAKPPR